MSKAIGLIKFVEEDSDPSKLQGDYPNLDSYDAEIRDEYGDVSSATVGKPSLASVIHWYKEHGVDFKDVKWNDESKMFTYVGKVPPVSFKGRKF